MERATLLSLPRDILVMLPNYLDTIEDLMNLSSTCRTLRSCMATALPNTILRLAAAQADIFFRPAPFFLAAATARELGNWARLSDKNEAELATKVDGGIDALMDLALAHCGLTMARIRELHALRLTAINPAEEILDECVGKQWWATADYCSGAGVDDADTVAAEPSETIFHLVIYGELFAPDLEAVLDQQDTQKRLKPATRLEVIKYCLPDFACHVGGQPDSKLATTTTELDPLRAVKSVGPYATDPDGIQRENDIIALMWVISSSKWRRRWHALRQRAGAADFQVDFADKWLDSCSEHAARDWRQRLWENVMMCQGFEGLEMLVQEEGTMQDRWGPRIVEWRDKIAQLEREPAVRGVGSAFTLDYPWLLGDLRCCISGFCGYA